MKNFLTLSVLFSALLLSALPARAYNFSRVSPSGHVLYYDLVGGQAIVTHTTNDYSNYAGHLVIPDSVTYSGQTYPVTAIGVSAFYRHNLLSAVTIPATVEVINNNAFSECNQLDSVFLPNTLTTIGSSAFKSCGSLSYVPLPSSLTSVGDQAFAYAGLTSVAIPPSVTSLGSSAFAHCSSLDSVVIGCSHSAFGTSVFEDCYRLTSVTFPSDFANIANYTFTNCFRLVSIDLPNGLNSIGDAAFSGCSSLASIAFPSSVTYIGEWAFSFCVSLDSIAIPSSVTHISDGAFSYCSGLTSVSLPSGITSIGNSSFRECTNLTSVTLPNSVICVHSLAFESCYHLAYFDFGSGIETIEDNVFDYCSQLADVYVRNPVPPVVGDQTFTRVPSTTLFHIPCNSLVAYHSQSLVWRYLNVVSEMLFVFSATADDPSQGSVEVCHTPTCDNMMAEVYAVPNEGYHFSHWSDGSTDPHHYVMVLHDLALVAYFEEGNAPVSIDDPAASSPETDFRLWSSDHCIHLALTNPNSTNSNPNSAATNSNNTATTWSIYDLSGRQLQRLPVTTSTSDPLSVGLYLVQVGETPAKKVAVW